MPALSLCMIVRDEEALLGGCLDSVRGVVSEIIVVDTGSSDRTPDIAAAAGARLVDFEWIDDFAAARNAGLELASGTHVLVLDADERLGPGAAEALKRAVRDSELLLGSLPLHTAAALDCDPARVVAGAQRRGAPSWLPRLFRNRPELRFERRVHESVAAAFNRLQAAGEGVARAIDAPIVHLGDVPELRRSRAKDERNERLLRRALQDDPRDGELAGYLISRLLRTGRMAEARRLGEDLLPGFIASIDELPAGLLPPNVVPFGYGLGLAQLQEGAPAAALASARTLRARCVGDHPNLAYLEGLAHERLGALEPAEEAFRQCLSMRAQTFASALLEGVTDELPRLRLANLLLGAGEPERARAEVAGLGGQFAVAADLISAEAALALGEPLAALQRLAPHVDRPDLPPDFQLLTGLALERLGEDPGQLLEQARSAPAQRWIEPRRRARSVNE